MRTWMMKCCVVLVVLSVTLGSALEIFPNVCSSPYPPMPRIFTNTTHTTENGLSCYECEKEDTTQISDSTCGVTSCTGTGGNGAACYRWEFTYKGIGKNVIRTGCAVNCSSIHYEQYMCSGVGERVFEECNFVMCKGNKCNAASTLIYNEILTLLTLLLLLYTHH